MKKSSLLFAFILTISALVSNAANLERAENLAGTWKYTVLNVPPEYETGSITFEEKDGKWSGYIGETEKIEMKELVVDDNKISFKRGFDGGILTIKLVLENDKLDGTIVSQDGEFPISAVKEEKK